MHFCIGVITNPDGPDPYEVMDKFDENAHTEFYNLMEQIIDEYNSNKEKRVVTPHGEYLQITSSEIKKECTKEEYNKWNGRKDMRWSGNPSEDNTYYIYDPTLVNGTIKEIPVKEIYPSAQEYAENEYSWSWDDEQQAYGEWFNPDGRYDWCSIGGRWSNLIKKKPAADGTVERCDSAIIKDIDFTPDKEAYDHAIRYWEITVEGATKTEEEKKNVFGYSKEYLLKNYDDKITYAKAMSMFTTYAVITPDKEWHEKPYDDENKEQDWNLNYLDNFIKAYDENYILTIIDCHE